jgi:hypothetical protein
MPSSLVDQADRVVLRAWRNKKSGPVPEKASPAVIAHAGPEGGMSSCRRPGHLLSKHGRRDRFPPHPIGLAPWDAAIR